MILLVYTITITITKVTITRNAIVRLTVIIRHFINYYLILCYRIEFFKVKVVVKVKCILTDENAQSESSTLL